MAEQDGHDGHWGWTPPAAPIAWGPPSPEAGPGPVPGSEPPHATGPYAAPAPTSPYGPAGGHAPQTPPYAPGPYGAGPYGPPPPPPGSPWGPPPPIGQPPHGPSGQRYGILILLGVIFGAMLLLGTAIAAVTFLGSSAEETFEPVGTPIQSGDPTAANGVFQAEEVIGEGDPGTFRAVMPSADEVLDTMGPAEHLALRRQIVDRAGQVNNQCTDISANAVASDVQIWLDDDPDGGWELQAAVFDYGTPEQAHRVVTARHSDAFLTCIPEAAGQASMAFENTSGVLLEHNEDPGKGGQDAAQTVLLQGYWMTGCGKDAGRMAMEWRQVGQYTISAKAFGCDGIDADTVGPVLDAMAQRLP